MISSTLVAGSSNVTGMNVIRALLGNVDNLVGYDCCPINQNPSQLFCVNESVPRASEKGYVDAVLASVKRHKANFIIASNDHEVRTLAENLDRFNEAGVVINAMTPLTLKFLDKLATSELFVAHGIPTPRVLDIRDLEPPYVCRKQHVGSGKKYSYVVTSSSEERAAIFGSDSSAIFTQYVKGDEYTIDILARRGEAIAVVPRQRHEVRHGMVHFGEVVKDYEIIEWAHRIANVLKFDGMYCIQCIKNADGCFFFEVNPRPGSGLDLTIAAGINMPAMWIDQHLGVITPHQDPVWGMKMVRYYSGHYFR